MNPDRFFLLFEGQEGTFVLTYFIENFITEAIRDESKIEYEKKYLWSHNITKNEQLIKKFYTNLWIQFILFLENFEKMEWIIREL